MVDDTRLPVGTPIQVRNQFDGAWTSGFLIVDVRTEEDAYRVQRRSDRTLLPEFFGPDDVRPERGAG
jgi:hypothetical protein